jgi:LPS export ABC transporter protein LptC
MNKIICFLTFFTLVIYPVCFAEGEGDQQIMDFKLAGYTQTGEKTWDVKGQSADIMNDDIALKQIQANSYSKEEQINLVADKGNFDKNQTKLHLQDNVVITTNAGAKLTTDSLDWSQNQDLISTKDKVNIDHEMFMAEAKGLEAKPNLNSASLMEQVEVTVKDSKKKTDPKNSTVITCDGPLEIDYDKGSAVFNKNVKATSPGQGDIYADKMTAFFRVGKSKSTVVKSSTPGFLGNKDATIEKIVAEGNVKILKDDNVVFSDEATYDAIQKKILLTGSPKLFIYTEKSENQDASFGN